MNKKPAGLYKKKCGCQYMIDFAGNRINAECKKHWLAKLVQFGRKR